MEPEDPEASKLRKRVNQDRWRAVIKQDTDWCTPRLKECEGQLWRSDDTPSLTKSTAAQIVSFFLSGQCVVTCAPPSPKARAADPRYFENAIAYCRRFDN